MIDNRKFMQKLAGTDQDKVEFGENNLDFGLIVTVNKIKPHFSETEILEPIVGNA